MSGVPVSLQIVAIAVSLCGALVLAGLAGTRTLARPRRAGRRSLPGAAGLREGAGWLVVAAGAAALWLPREAVVALFALASTVAVAAFLGSGTTRATGQPLHVLCCYVCVPLQYGFIIAGRYELFAVAVPLFATIAIPLLTIAQGETHMLERVAERHWGVMVWVYFLSHAPALLMFDLPGAAGDNGGLVAFLVALALASQGVWALACRAGERFVTGARSLDAFAFAAPVFFYAGRGWSVW
jgi:phosphatidate cytidylyltransferase